MSVSKEAIEAGLRITLSSVNMPSGECLHETDVREILEAALPFLPIAGEAPEGWQLVPKEPTVARRMPWKTMRGDAWYDKYRAMLAAAPVPPSSPGKDGGQEVEAVELIGIDKELAEESGFWRSCSGCHNLNEGVATGPYSNIMECHLGFGCRECGGIGAIWDNVNYSDFGLQETASVSTASVEWKVVPDEMTTELLAAATKGLQVLAYEKGRYYNAWLEFEQSEGGWIWFDEADSEPNPSHYCELPPEPALSASQSTSRENADA